MKRWMWMLGMLAAAGVATAIAQQPGGPGAGGPGGPDNVHLSLEGYGVFAERLKPLVTTQAVAIPQSVEQLWTDFDPRKDALETELIR